SVGPVECIEKAIPVRQHENFAPDAARIDIGEYGNLDSIPIVSVMWCELIMPAQLSGIPVDGHDRSRVKIVPFTHIAQQIRTGLPGSPKKQVQFGIVCSGEPRRTSTMFPGVASPGLTAR